MITDRFRDALRALIGEMLDERGLPGVYLYAVASFDEGAQTADLQPLNGKGLPTLAKIPIRTPGLQVKLVNGEQVLVGFQASAQFPMGDPSQPYVASLMTASTYVAALAAAAQGDMTATTLTLVPQTGGSAVTGFVIAQTVPPGPGGPTTFYGAIVSGSGKVKRA